MSKVPVKLVSWEEIVEWSRGLAKKIIDSGWTPDIIIAVARGGYVPARLLCDFLNVENLTSLQSQHWTEAARAAEKATIKFPYKIDLKGLRALIVDDITDTGDTLILARNFIADNWNPQEVKTATLQWISSVAKIKPDYYYIEVKEWVWFQYPWTRLEDITSFLKKMFEEEYKVNSKDSWTDDEIRKTFYEWYGFHIDNTYYPLAIEQLLKKGLIAKYSNNMYVFKMK